jgi:hypothetical protein
MKNRPEEPVTGQRSGDKTNSPRTFNRAEILTILEPTIAFHRLFGLMAGGAAGGVFLSQLYYWSTRKNPDPDGWVYKSASEWFEETTLTRRELDSIRRFLRETGIIEETLARVPAVTHYRIQWENFDRCFQQAYQAMQEYIAKRLANEKYAPKRQTEAEVRSAPKRQTERTETPNKIGENRQTTNRSEITAEITTKMTKKRASEKRARRASRKESSSFLSAVPGEGDGKVTNEISQPPSSADALDPVLPASHEFVYTPEKEEGGASGNGTLASARVSKPGDDASELDVAIYCAEKYGYLINTRNGTRSDLARKLDGYLHRLGPAYVMEKDEVMQDPKYASTLRKSFFAALKGDWQLLLKPEPKQKPRPAEHGFAPTLETSPPTPPAPVEESQQIAASLKAFRLNGLAST